MFTTQASNLINIFENSFDELIKVQVGMNGQEEVQDVLVGVQGTELVGQLLDRLWIILGYDVRIQKSGIAAK